MATGRQTSRQSKARSLERPLRSRGALARAIIDSIDARVAVLDPKGKIIMTNRAWEQFALENSAGQPEKLGVGANYVRVCRSASGESAEGAKDVLVGLGEVLSGQAQNFCFEYPCHSPTDRRWFLLQATGLGSRAGGAVLLHIDVTARKLMEGRILEQERARVMTIGLLKGQEEEQSRIARELHDGLNQRLGLMLLDLGMLLSQIPQGSADLIASLNKLQAQMKQLSADIGRISHQLHPVELELLGVVSALESQCIEFGRQGIETKFIVSQEPHDVPADVALCLYRITQESLHNVAKHSGATQVCVELAGGPDVIMLAITDNGRGFDQSQEHTKSGLGLVSMRDRACLLGGSFKVSSEVGGGTKVQVMLPVGEQTARSDQPNNHPLSDP